MKTRTDLTPCRVGFDCGPTFDAFTDGTTWNGWLNVWVTPETHAAVIAAFEAAGDDCDDFRAMPVEDGLVSYAHGYCVSPITPEDEAWLAAMRAFDACANTPATADDWRMVEASNEDLRAWVDDMEARVGLSVTAWRAAVEAFIAARNVTKEG